jgi:protein O-mannosyl-transferase
MNQDLKKDISLLGTACFLGIIAFLFYLPALYNEFINWDDPQFILNNPFIRSLHWASLQRMFAIFYEANWTPLSWLSLALDFHIGGLAPPIYHFHGILLHALNTTLVFLLAVRFFRLVSQRMDATETSGDWIWPAAWLSALMFGLHPIHVESVVWAAERRDLLCGFYFFAALWVYLDYAPHPKPWKLGVCLSLFLFALLSKPMAITFPVVLLLLDGWPLGRLGPQYPKVLLEKLPFFILSVVAGTLAVSAQSAHGAFDRMRDIPLSFRLANACHSVFFYLWKMIFPLHLAVYYPLLYQGKIPWEYLLASLLLVLTSLACFRVRLQKPYLITAWLYFGLTLLPVLGLLQVGTQAAADRYTYIPSLGPFLLTSAMAARCLSKRRTLFLVLALALSAFWGFRTISQIRVWQNSISLWEQDLEHYPVSSGIAHINLGNAYGDAGRFPDAIREFDQAISAGPPDSVAHEGKGVALLQMGRIGEAIPEFQAAIALAPGFVPPRVYLCRIYQLSKQFNEALSEAQAMVRLNPGSAGAYDLLGMSYAYLNQPGEAVAAFHKAISLDPGNNLYFSHLAMTDESVAKNLKKK